MKSEVVPSCKVVKWTGGWEDIAASVYVFMQRGTLAFPAQHTVERNIYKAAILSLTLFVFTVWSCQDILSEQWDGETFLNHRRPN